MLCRCKFWYILNMSRHTLVEGEVASMEQLVRGNIWIFPNQFMRSLPPLFYIRPMINLITIYQREAWSCTKYTLPKYKNMQSIINGRNHLCGILERACIEFYIKFQWTILARLKVVGKELNYIVEGQLVSISPFSRGKDSSLKERLYNNVSVWKLFFSLRFESSS